MKVQGYVIEAAIVRDAERWMIRSREWRAGDLAATVEPRLPKSVPAKRRAEVSSRFADAMIRKHRSRLHLSQGRWTWMD